MFRLDFSLTTLDFDDDAELFELPGVLRCEIRRIDGSRPAFEAGENYSARRAGSDFALEAELAIPGAPKENQNQHAAKIGSGFTGPPDRAQAGIFTPVTQLIQSPAHRTSGGGGGSALQHSQKLNAQRGGSARFGARFGPAAPGRRHGRFQIRFLTPFC